MNGQKQARMQELVKLLNLASKAYYQDAEEITSNYDYDKLYDELCHPMGEKDSSARTEKYVNQIFDLMHSLKLANS